MVKQSNDKMAESILNEIRMRREKALKDRDRARKVEGIKLSKEEALLWESEKRLIKSQKKFLKLKEQYDDAEKEYQNELWQFIQNWVKANQVKRNSKKKSTKI
ncbi:MAG: hypothetical protein ABI663_06615 [Chryseolinea sp.]